MPSYVPALPRCPNFHSYLPSPKLSEQGVPLHPVEVPGSGNKDAPRLPAGCREAGSEILRQETCDPPVAKGPAWSHMLHMRSVVPTLCVDGVRTRPVRDV
ncbi:hypothetical protein GCM10009801_07520 [Streptomyces albiaxialis]|uniref:Uncharacterized protein n=1 Tax=Streptomyces albiaxialis TaxID=329523 RepID=A0ABN2VKF0_9ACTN